MARDFTGDATFESLEQQPKPVVEAANATWRKRCREFISGADTAEATRQRKRYRVKSYQWLLCLDNALLVSSGAGLDRYIPGEGQDPWTWRSLSVASDQGSDALCATNWLAYGPGGANVDRVDDASHGVHNDLMAMIRPCGLAAHQLLMNLSRNAIYGPFDEGRRHIECRQAIEEWSKRCAWECPVFRAALPGILDDKGESDRLTQPGIEQDIFDEFVNHRIWHTKGAKLSTSRFCSMIYKAQDRSLFGRSGNPERNAHKPQSSLRVLGDVMIFLFGGRGQGGSGGLWETE